MAVQVGLTCVASHMSAGTYGSPTWSPATSCAEATLNIDASAVEASTRGSVWRKFLPGLRNLSADMKFIRNNSDTIQAALETAFVAGTSVIFAFTDAAIATVGTQGIKGEFMVSKFSQGEPIDGAASLDVTLQPIAGGNGPEFLTVAS
jgi:predicted secreted protein